jgi:selenocysteine lyase/cysteine desulfurase
MTPMTPAAPMSVAAFRSLFPATQRWAWFDTPGCPPAAAPVASVLGSVIADWQSGDFEWLAWDAVPQHARQLFATLIGADVADVAQVSSVSEAAATVAAALPPGAVVMLADEYRSVLYPFLARRGADVVLIPQSDDPTAALIDALTTRTALVAVSEVLSSDGVRIDLTALREATNAAGARLFVDATQALGVLDTDYRALAPDYLAVHGYKWLLCPRGAAWLVTRADRTAELMPIAPGWKSTELPHGYFGGSLELAGDAMRLDASPAWFAWIGACAALELQLSLNRSAVTEHVVALTDRAATDLRRIGFRTPNHRGDTHILVVEYDTDPGVPQRLLQAGVKATATDRRLRIGVHYFNTDSDVDRLLDVLSPT